jgi:hypothetical protein
MKMSNLDVFVGLSFCSRSGLEILRFFCVFREVSYGSSLDCYTIYFLGSGRILYRLYSRLYK